MSAERVIEIARGELGTTEYPPGSNHVRYWNDYDERMQGQPWCVTFLWWCFQHAGEKMAFFAGAKTASCGTLWRWYQAQGLTVPVDEIQPGDLVFMNFHGGLSPEHIGLAEETGYYVGKGFAVLTLEGNTTPGDGDTGSQDNGGCVASKKRWKRQIIGVARPEYKEEPMPKSDYENHWAREDIEWAKHIGFLKGYPDGSFRPDQEVTRAETAAILRRVTDHLLGEIAEANAKIIVLEAEITAMQKEARA